MRSEKKDESKGNHFMNFEHKIKAFMVNVRTIFFVYNIRYSARKNCKQFFLYAVNLSCFTSIKNIIDYA